MTATRRNQACEIQLARRAHGLPQAARADRAVPRLLGRPAAGAVRRHAAGVDARGRRQPRHHRAVRAGRHAVHGEIHLGAAGRCARRAGAVALARPPPRLAGVLAGAADRSDRVPRPDRSGGGAMAGGARRAAGRHGLGDPGHRDRRLPGRKPRRKRAGRRHGLLCRGLPGRHAGFDRGRAVHGVGLRVARPRPPRRLERRLRRDGRAGADRHRHHA